jgi:hypothetical protein
MGKTEKSNTLSRFGSGMGSRPSTADSGRMTCLPGVARNAYLNLHLAQNIRSSKFPYRFRSFLSLVPFCNAELELPEEHLGDATSLSTTLPISTHGVSRTRSPAPAAYLRS